MPFNLIELLNIPVMRQAKVLTAQNTLECRYIEAVSVIEIPVEDFVRRNELVISTAMGCNGDIEVFRGFLQYIFESGAAALVIATGRHITEIPEELLLYAGEVCFPIIEIPWEVRFGDIIEAVLGELNNRHQTKLKKYEELQNRLVSLFLNGSHLSDAAELICRELGRQVAIVGSTGIIKGRSKASDAFIEILTPYLHRAFSFNEAGNDFPPMLVREEAFDVLNIQSAHRLHGYILIQGEHFEAENSGISGHITAAAALWFQREQAIYETELRFKEDLVWSIAKGEIDSWDTAAARAKTMGYNLELPYICIVGSLDGMETLYRDRKTAETSYEQWLYNIVGDIREQITWAGKSMKQATLMTFQQDRLVVYLEALHTGMQQNANRFLDLVENRCKRLFPGIIMSWGIGENHAGARTFHEGFVDAKLALDICCRQKGAGHRSTYADTNIYRILHMLASDAEVQKIVQLTTSTLLNYDERHGLELVNTLRAYVENGGNVSRTARVLNLHRQSLIYRLKKIESLTNRSLDNTDDLFLLDLSIRLWKAGGI